MLFLPSHASSSLMPSDTPSDNQPGPAPRAARPPAPSAPVTPAHDSLAALAARAAAGDHGAFEQIHRRLSDGLRRLFLKRSGGRNDLADDLTQRAFIASWQAISTGRYDPARSAISTFIYAVGYKIWLQHLRAHGRAVPQDRGEELADLPVSTDPTTAPALAELVQVVRDCLSGRVGDLSEDERAILRAVAAGESDRATARRLGLAASTANARKNAAYEKLRRTLSSLGFRPEETERILGGGE